MHAGTGLRSIALGSSLIAGSSVLLCSKRVNRYLNAPHRIADGMTRMKTFRFAQSVIGTVLFMAAQAAFAQQQLVQVASAAADARVYLGVAVRNP